MTDQRISQSFRDFIKISISSTSTARWGYALQGFETEEHPWLNRSGKTKGSLKPPTTKDLSSNLCTRP